jgi:hypothetical protein
MLPEPLVPVSSCARLLLEGPTAAHDVLSSIPEDHRRVLR